MWLGIWVSSPHRCRYVGHSWLIALLWEVWEQNGWIPSNPDPDLNLRLFQPFQLKCITQNSLKLCYCCFAASFFKENCCLFPGKLGSERIASGLPFIDSKSDCKNTKTSNNANFSTLSNGTRYWGRSVGSASWTPGKAHERQIIRRWILVGRVVLGMTAENAPQCCLGDVRLH